MVFLPKTAVPRSFSAICRGYLRAISFSAPATTFSTVNPKCGAKSLYGADSPTVVIPIMSPWVPMYLYQHIGEPASMARRFQLFGGNTESRYAYDCRSKISMLGIL